MKIIEKVKEYLSTLRIIKSNDSEFNTENTIVCNLNDGDGTYENEGDKTPEVIGYNALEDSDIIYDHIKSPNTEVLVFDENDELFQTKPKISTRSKITLAIAFSPAIFISLFAMLEILAAKWSWFSNTALGHSLRQVDFLQYMHVEITEHAKSFWHSFSATVGLGTGGNIAIAVIMGAFVLGVIAASIITTKRCIEKIIENRKDTAASFIVPQEQVSELSSELYEEPVLFSTNYATLTGNDFASPSKKQNQGISDHNSSENEINGQKAEELQACPSPSSFMPCCFGRK